MGGGAHHHSPAAMPVENQDIELLKKNQVPTAFRDKCAHLLVKLNQCRRETYFHPEKCGQQRHTYEECEYIAWTQRVDAKKQQMVAAAAAATAIVEE